MNITEYAITKKMFSGSGGTNVGGEINIKKNGEFDVAKYAKAIVNVLMPTNLVLEVDELPTEDINMNAVYTYNGELYKYTGEGWRFNDTIIPPSEMITTGAVEINGIVYRGMTVSVTGYITLYSGTPVYAYDGSSWLSDEYKTVKFVDEVDEIFLAWLNENATNMGWVKYPNPNYETWEFNDTITELPDGVNILTFLYTDLGTTQYGVKIIKSSSGSAVRKLNYVGEAIHPEYGYPISNPVVYWYATSDPEQSLGWTDEKYKTITFTEPITDETFLAWLKANAKRVSPFIPTGTLEITENGPYDVTEYASVTVNVEGSGGGEENALAEFLAARNCDGLCKDRTNITNLPDIDATGVTNMHQMFYGCKSLSSVNLSNTSAVTDMSSMFYGCSVLSSVNLSNTSAVTNMSSMFHKCGKLRSVPLFDTSSVTSMSNMFASCVLLTTVPLFDTSSVTNMSQMFASCTTLSDVPLFDTSSVTDMSGMFSYCTTLATVPLFDTSSVTSMSQMFSNCTTLSDVPAFDTRSVTSMFGTFSNCKSLTTVSPLDIRSVTTTTTIFNGCAALTDIHLRNIKTALTVGVGTSYGHLLTIDSLTHLIYELRDTGSSKTLTVGSANLEKLANVYVKSIDITDEMRAEDDLVDEKLPFVVCESTDEGATLITTYVGLKNWKLA